METETIPLAGEQGWDAGLTGRVRQPWGRQRVARQIRDSSGALADMSELHFTLWFVILPERSRPA